MQVPWPYPDDAAQYWFNSIQPKIQNGEMLCWAICEKDKESDLIGVLSYCFDEEPKIRRGFWLAEPFHGLGYMTEAVTLMQDHIFFDIELEEIIVMNAITNTASRRIKEKTGGVLIGTTDFEHHSGDMKSEIWRIKRADWALIRKVEIDESG